MLYEEKRKEQEREIDFKHTFYVPYHVRAKKLYKVLQENFGIYTIYRKTMTLGDLILKKGKQMESNSRNTVYTKYLASNVTKHTLDNPKTQSTREIANTWQCAGGK